LVASDFPLRASLDGLREKMIVDFREVTAQIGHRGAKGHEREALIARDYLRHYVPRTLEIVHGAEILDSEGNRSAECDLVVQSAATPPLMIGKDFHLVPVEWVYGVIEVKSRLDANQLTDAQEKIARSKTLRKLTYLEQTGDVLWSTSAYGRTFDHFPMYGMVFAFSGSGLAGLCDKLWEQQQGVPIDRWIDAVVVLDQGLLLYGDAAGGSAVRPEPGSYLRAIQSENPLVATTLVLQTAFAGVWERPARLGPYMGPEPWGEIVGTAGP
jgi:hypothetical protein